jgi:hypothetical protein
MEAVNGERPINWQGSEDLDVVDDVPVWLCMALQLEVVMVNPRSKSQAVREMSRRPLPFGNPTRLAWGRQVRRNR